MSKGHLEDKGDLMFCCGKHIKIEAETCADPVWCAVCGANLELDDFPLSDELMKELWEWNLQYHHWLSENDYDDSQLFKNVGFNLIAQHNEQGKSLAEKVQKELGSEVQVCFSPIKMTSDS